MAIPSKLYLIWQDLADELYFNQYQSLEDAVRAEPDRPVYECTLNLLGKFELVTKVVKKKKEKK